MTNQISLGADPEFLLIDERIMEVITALDLPGTKDEPIQIEGMPDGYNYHRDNVLLEVGIPPARNALELDNNLDMVMRAANNILPRVLEKDYAQIWYGADKMEFDDEDLNDPLAQEFGCEPDQNAYEGGAQRAAPDGVMGNWRTAGGHIHLGSEKGFNAPGFIVALLCDLTIGYYLARFSSKTDAPHMWYRRPGLYRDKPYGIEYRTPSNLWVMNSAGVRRSQVASLAESVASYAANAPANAIRDLVQKTDWIHVRNVVSGNVPPKEGFNDKVITEMRGYVV